MQRDEYRSAISMAKYFQQKHKQNSNNKAKPNTRSPPIKHKITRKRARILPTHRNAPKKQTPANRYEAAIAANQTKNTSDFNVDCNVCGNHISTLYGDRDGCLCEFAQWLDNPRIRQELSHTLQAFPCVFRLWNSTKRYSYYGYAWDARTVGQWHESLFVSGTHPSKSLQRIFSVDGPSSIVLHIVERLQSSVFGHESTLDTTNADKLLKTRCEFYKVSAKHRKLNTMLRLLGRSHITPAFLSLQNHMSQQQTRSQIKSTLVIQQSWRCFRARCELDFRQKTQAVRVLQRFWRGHLARTLLVANAHVMLQHRAALKLQCWARVVVSLQVKRECIGYRHLEDSAWIIQSAWRSFFNGKVGQIFLLKRKRTRAAVQIQNWWRSSLARRLVHRIREKRAAILVQTMWRRLQASVAYKITLMLRHEEEKRRDMASTRIQQAFKQKAARQNAREQRQEEIRRLQSAATRVQAQWRRRQGQFAYHLKQHALREAASELNAHAVRIQCWWASVRLNTRVQKRQTVSAAAKIQQQWRGREMIKIAREKRKILENIRSEQNAAIKIQSRIRARAARVRVGVAREAKCQLQRENDEIAAVRLQSIWRMRTNRRWFQRKQAERINREQQRERTATKLQSRFRGWTARVRVNVMKEEARRPKCDECSERACSKVCTQCTLKLCEFCSECIHSIPAFAVHDVFDVDWTHEHVKMATRLQSVWRGHRARKKTKILRKKLGIFQAEIDKRVAASVLVQRNWRGRLGKRDAERQRRLVERHRRHKAALVIQKQVRVFLVRIDLRRRHQAATRVQTRYRIRQGKMSAHLRRAALHQHEEERQVAASKMQGMWRARQAKAERMVLQHGKDEEEEAQKQNAAVKLQARMRGRNARKQVVNDRDVDARKQAEEQHAAANKLQAAFRGKSGRTKVREMRAASNSEREAMAAIKLQSHWRARQARRKMKDRLKLQAERKIQARAERRAAIRLQKAWRARMARRRVALKRAQQRAALRIQRVWRGKNGRFSAMLLSRAKFEYEENDRDGEEEMPPGWEKFNDSESGEVYYYNEATDSVAHDLTELGNTMWAKDWEAEEEGTGVLQIGKWQVLCDEEEAATLGRMYFYDAENGHVTWRCPEELQGQVERNPHDVWQVSIDTDTGHKTYFNIDTNEHTWMRPVGLGVDPDRKPGDEWLATMHAVSEEPYYTNLDTGEVVWERPQILGMLWEEKIEADEPHSTFWQNKVTGEVTTERPLEYMSPEERQIAINKMNAKTWYAQDDETSGKEYYVLWNPQTEAVDQVTWDKPHELMTTEEIQAKERKEWDTYWSAEDHAEYYVNRVTEEVTWRKPDCLR